jgi:CBS domain-containing protein
MLWGEDGRQLHRFLGLLYSLVLAHSQDAVQDFDKQVSTEPLAVEDIAPLLSAHVLRMYIDLKPYVNPASYVVQRSCCATQAYMLFQTLGLRHLCVVEDTSAVLGVLTRKDFMAANVQNVISNRVEVETRVKRGSGSSSNGNAHLPTMDSREADPWNSTATASDRAAADVHDIHTNSAEPKRPAVIRSIKRSPRSDE